MRHSKGTFCTSTRMQTTDFFSRFPTMSRSSRVFLLSFLFFSLVQPHACTHTRLSDRISVHALISRLTFWYYCFFFLSSVVVAVVAFSPVYASTSARVCCEHFVKGTTEMTKRNETTIKWKAMHTVASCTYSMSKRNCCGFFFIIFVTKNLRMHWIIEQKRKMVIESFRVQPNFSILNFIHLNAIRLDVCNILTIHNCWSPPNKNKQILVQITTIYHFKYKNVFSLFSQLNFLIKLI